MEKNVLFVLEPVALLNEDTLVDNEDDCESCSAADCIADETNLIGYMEIITSNVSKQIIGNLICERKPKASTYVFTVLMNKCLF